MTASYNNPALIADPRTAEFQSLAEKAATLLDKRESTREHAQTMLRIKKMLGIGDHRACKVFLGFHEGYRRGDDVCWAMSEREYARGGKENSILLGEVMNQMYFLMSQLLTDYSPPPTAQS